MRLDLAGCRAAGRVVPDVGSRVPGRRGEAVHLGDLLGRHAPAPGSTHVTLESGDGHWSASLPVEEVAEGWLVFALDGAPLPREQGGPFRLFLPGQGDACANVKDLARITFGPGPGRDTRPPEDERAC